MADLTIQKIASDVLKAQDACNLSGLVHSWSVWLPTIRADAVAKGIQPNEHPLNVLMADKVASLSGYNFSAAYDAALALSE